jgi:hypothetical protein
MAAKGSWRVRGRLKMAGGCDLLVADSSRSVEVPLIAVVWSAK